MQLNLPLALQVEYGEDNFVISSCNYEAYRAITSDTWYNNRIMIIGEKGCGKTHIATIWARKNNALFINRNFNFNANSNLILENIETFCSKEDEEFLFHLINYCQANSLNLLLTAQELPKFTLKDLKSRIQATQYFLISWPDTELIKLIMLKQFSDRQLEVPFSVIEYASSFLPRDFQSIKKFISRIDEFSLRKKRNITTPFIKEYFANDQNLENLVRNCENLINSAQDEQNTA